MKFVIALPDCDYYLWQMLVQINNFRKLGFEENTIYLIGKTSIQTSSTLLKIMNGGIRSSFFIFNDLRINPRYSPSLKPYLMKCFIEQHPEIKNEVFFFTDPDVIFTKKIKFSDSETNNNVWYMSDTQSYLNSTYIKSKGLELFKEMCKIVGIDEELVEKNDKNAGGAQIIVKNTTSDFWKKVELDSENLYIHMIETSNKYNPKHPIQAWTAEMWATLWNAWLFGHETKIIKKMNFSWATDLINKWDESSIYHNAGAVVENGDYFLKSKYQRSPFNLDLKITNKYCSFNYVKEIKETEKNFNKILF
jgi:hypothetical protein